MTDFITWYLDYGQDLYFDVYLKATITESIRLPVVKRTKIENYFELPNNDVMIGFKNDEYNFIQYFNINEIELIGFEEEL